MTRSARAGADGGDSGGSVPLPRDWPDGGGSSGWYRTESRVLREVAERIRGLAGGRSGERAGPGWNDRGAVGAVRPLDGQPGLWATGRSVQHLHAQLQKAVTVFHGALVAGLPAVAARMEESAKSYDRADRTNAHRIDQAAGGLDNGTSLPASSAPATAPSVVGADGRF